MPTYPVRAFVHRAYRYVRFWWLLGTFALVGRDRPGDGGLADRKGVYGRNGDIRECGGLLPTLEPREHPIDADEDGNE